MRLSASATKRHLTFGWLLLPLCELVACHRVVCRDLDFDSWAHKREAKFTSTQLSFSLVLLCACTIGTSMGMTAQIGLDAYSGADSRHKATFILPLLDQRHQRSVNPTERSTPSRPAAAFR
jgi:hypothetical protein